MTVLSLSGCTVTETESGSGYGVDTPNVAPPASYVPEDAEQVASFDNQATIGIASDASYTYVSIASSNGGAGEIVRLGDDGTTVLAPFEDSPYAIALDDQYVYYTLQNEGVRRVKKSGGSVPEDVAMLDDASAGASGIAVSGDYVYFTSSTGVYRVSKLGDGSDLTLFAADSNGADALVADATAVYWMDFGTTASNIGALKRADIATGTVTVMGSGPTFANATTFSLAQDAGSLYFVDPSAGRVYAMSKTDGSVISIATGVASPQAVAVDDANVYVTSMADGARAIYAASKTSVGQVTLLTGAESSGIYALSVDSTYVWFTNDVTTGSVYRVPTMNAQFADGYSQ